MVYDPTAEFGSFGVFEAGKSWEILILLVIFEILALLKSFFFFFLNGFLSKSRKSSDPAEDLRTLGPKSHLYNQR